MPRRSRLSLPGIPWHIIQRGNNRTACFFAEADYRRYLDALTEQADRFNCAVHAYVLMTNHVHLLLTPFEEGSASLVMKHLGQRYVQTINRTYRRSGTLWEGRFRSCLAQSEEYVLACYRYIEMNPVRAGMVAHPRDYRWSSYRANGEAANDALISFHEEYLRLGADEGERRARYRQFFASKLDPETVDQIRTATNGGFALGAAQFTDQIAKALRRRVVRAKAGRPFAEPHT